MASRSFLSRAFLSALLVLSGVSASAEEILDFHADEYTTDLGTRVMHATGKVSFEMGGRKLEADAVDIIPLENRFEARGKVRITQGALTIEGTEAKVESTSGRGNFRNAVLRYGKAFYVEGRELEALGEQRYKVTNGKISICQDCPQSWSVFGTSIELEIEGYAEIHHALFQVKDQPVAYFPIFYFPIKTKRQSGFLIPEVLFSQDLGSEMGQSYFWAIGPDQDATFDYRYMTRGGQRIWSQYRYLYSDRSFIDTKSAFVRNFSVPNVGDNRYGFSLKQRWQASPQWVERYQGEIASDPRYTASFGEDFQNTQMPTLSNAPSVAWQNSLMASSLEGNWNANNLIRDPTKGVPSQGALNALPEFRFSVPSFSLLGPLRFSSDLEHLSLRRRGGPVDPETKWIREGDRSSLSTRAFMPNTIADLVRLESSVETRTDLYHFQAPGVAPSAARARVSFEEQLSTQLFRIYKVDLGELTAVKHIWEPTVSWSYSPNDAMTRHPFFGGPYNDTENNRTLISPKFDIYDPSSADVAQLLGSSVEARLRPHHLVSWGLGTRLVGRYERGASRVYEEMAGLQVSQDYDLRSHLAQRLNISGYGAYNGFRLQTQIALDVKTKDANVLNELSADTKSLDFGVTQSIRTEQNSYAGSIRLKFLRPWSFSYSANINALVKSTRFSDKITEEHYQIRYDSSASKCWFFSLDVGRKPDPDRPAGRISQYQPRIGYLINEAGVSL